MSLISRLRAGQADKGERSEGVDDELRRMRKEMARSRQSSGQTTGQGGWGRAARMAGKGFGDIAKSLATPSTRQRPKISQMPARRRDMGIVGHIDLNKMKTPGLRGRDIRGRRTR